MAEIKLKPCPFCGRDAITMIEVFRVNIDDCIKFSAYCPACHVGQNSNIVTSATFEEAMTAMQKAVEAWNRRTEYIGK